MRRRYGDPPSKFEKSEKKKNRSKGIKPGHWSHMFSPCGRSGTGDVQVFAAQACCSQRITITLSLRASPLSEK